MNSNQLVIKKLNEIEKDINELKIIVVQTMPYFLKQKVSLKGLLKGITIDEKDISESKKSLFKAM